MDQKQKAVIIAVMIGVGVVLGIFFLYGQTASPQVGYIDPLYIYPGQAWTNLISDKQANPSIPIIAIINPNSGPGTTIDPNYVTYTGDLQSAGITAVGYIWTGYGNISISQVETQASDYKSWYSVTGIFLDGMNNKAGGETYYSTITSWAHNNGFTLVVGNPGTSTIQSYLGTVDLMITYEAAGLPSPTTVASYTTSVGGTRNDWAIIAFSVSASPSQSYIATVSPFISWIFVTDQGLPNPYGAAPSYQATEISNLVASTSVAASTISGFTGLTSTSSPTQTQTTGVQGGSPPTFVIPLSTPYLEMYAIIAAVVVAMVAAVIIARRK